MYQLGGGLRGRRLVDQLVRLSGYGKIGLLSVVTGVSLVAFCALNGYAPGLLGGKSMTTAGYAQSRASAVIDLTKLDPVKPDSVNIAPAQSDQSDTVLVTTSSWMVQTDDFLENLRSESFWKKRSGAKRSHGGRVKNRRGNNGSVSGNPFWYSGNDGLTNEGSQTRRKVRNEDRWDVKVQQDVASQFYSGGGNTYRTLCVRICDGSFRPVSFSTTKSNFRRDERKCQKRNGRKAKLYVYRNPGQKIEDMADLRGRKYVKSTTAFLFRTVYNPSCKSKPHPWQIASLDRHKLYGMKASMRKLRGKTRRFARLEMRKFKKTMKRRRLDEGQRIAVIKNALAEISGAQISRTQTTSSRGQAAALSPNSGLQIVASHALTSGYQPSSSQSDLAKWRITTLSPIRALMVRPSQAALNGTGIQQANLVVVPDNDDNPIYLPVRLAGQGTAYLASRRSGTQPVQSKVTTSHKLAAVVTGKPAASVSSGAIHALKKPMMASIKPMIEVPTRRIAATESYGSGIATSGANTTTKMTDVAAIIVPDNDSSPIYLPTKNMFRGLSSIASIGASDLETEPDTELETNLRLGKRMAKAHRSSRMSLGARKVSAKKRAATAVRKPKKISRRAAQRQRRKKNWQSSIFSSGQ